MWEFPEILTHSETSDSTNLWKQIVSILSSNGMSFEAVTHDIQICVFDSILVESTKIRGISTVQLAGREETLYFPVPCDIHSSTMHPT